MSDTSEAEGEAPRVRILCAPPSTTSLHQPTPQFATLLIPTHNHPSPPRPARNPAAHQTGRHDQWIHQKWRQLSTSWQTPSFRNSETLKRESKKTKPEGTKSEVRDQSNLELHLPRRGLSRSSLNLYTPYVNRLEKTIGG